MKNKRQVATLMPYKIVDGELFIYLQKRTDDALRNSGLIGFFGGEIEKNEEPEEAIVREIKEELNIDIRDHVFIRKYDVGEHIQYSYAMEVSDDFDQTTEILEGEYGKFFSRKEIDNGLDFIGYERVVYEGFYKYLENKK